MQSQVAKILWGKRPGDEFESLITEQGDRIEEAKRWAKSQGFTEFRVATIDLAVPPDFTRTINRRR